ncbi:MAG: transglycosylase SLT domain-containing protein [Candidatus Aenigmarchaeota archaeon]|nr:transglycosylase SLT domain-containing protein [Candidatus Aenigmarchaeota archaeon]
MNGDQTESGIILKRLGYPDQDIASIWKDWRSEARKKTGEPISFARAKEIEEAKLSRKPNPRFRVNLLPPEIQRQPIRDWLRSRPKILMEGLQQLAIDDLPPPRRPRDANAASPEPTPETNPVEQARQAYAQGNDGEAVKILRNAGYSEQQIERGMYNWHQERERRRSPPDRMATPIGGGSANDPSRPILTVVSYPPQKIKFKINDAEKETSYRERFDLGSPIKLEAPEKHRDGNKFYKFKAWVFFAGNEKFDDTPNTIYEFDIEVSTRAVAVFEETTSEAEFLKPRSSLTPGWMPKKSSTFGAGRMELKAAGRLGQKNLPRVTMAVNRGKAELNSIGRLYAEGLLNEYQDRIKAAKERLVATRKDYFAAKKKALKSISAYGRFFRYTIRRGFKMPLGMGGTNQLLEDVLGKYRRDSEKSELRETFERFSNAEAQMNKLLTSELESLRDTIQKRLEPAAEQIAAKQIYRYKIGRDFTEAQEYIKAELKGEAAAFAEQYARTGRARLRGIAGAMTRLSMKSSTLRNIWYQMLYNIWDFIWGPMILGLIMTFVVMAGFISFFIIPTYALNASLFLYIIPLAGAAINWVMNFESNKYALDHLDSMVSGALIAQGITIFLFALIGQPGLYLDTFYYYMLFAFLFIFFGIFQFYQTGGFPIVLKMSVIVLIFGWVALGPYKAMYEGAINQVRTPVLVAWRAGTNAVSDISLLVTNPTAWYAKQQTTNVRPERPMAIPRALEITSINLLPQAVPQGAEFAMFLVVKNDGDLPARNIKIADENDIENVKCNSYCEFTDGKKAQITSLDKRNGEAYLMPGEAGRIEIRGLRAKYEKDRQAESRLGVVYINLSYEYSTNSSLLVSVMSKNEFQRRFAEKEDVFRQVVAVGKVSPAQLSLNVGPQPLESGKRALLLVSVSNARDDGRIFLRQLKDVIIIRMQKVIGRGLDCGAGGIKLQNPGKIPMPNQINVDFDPSREEALVYVMQNNQEIRQYALSSIFSVLCSFQPVPDSSLAATGVQTGLITAELPTYEFRIIKEQSVPITGFIGIAANPSDTKCSQCGTQIGILSSCTRSTCYSTKPQSGQCWLDTSQRPPGSGIIADTGLCRACFEKSCSTFTQKYDCETEASQRCSLGCTWIPSDKTTPVGIPGTDLQTTVKDRSYDGRCVAKTTTPGTTPTGAITCSVSGLSNDYINKYNQYKDVITSAVDSSGLKTAASSRGYNAEALLAALISQESEWNKDAVSPCGSAGIVQFIPKTARSLGLSVPVYNFEECNIDLCQIKVSACNSCTPTACSKSSDERFLPEKAIKAGAIHLTNEIERCGGITEGIGGYNGGTSCKEKNAGYTTAVLDKWYPKWVSCFNQAQQAQQAATTSFGGPDYCSNKLLARGTCTIGEGACKSTSECNPAYGGSIENTERIPLECRDPELGFNLCCLDDDKLGAAYANEHCRNKYNELKNK